jgi:myo-inositol-1(or 4)-monophosphatase
MDEATSALEADWLSACRRAVEGISAMLAASPTTAERVVETGGTGSGGDLTLVIDASAEAIVFGELDGLFERGFRFCAVSEERGWVSYGSDSVRVVIDPIDGSLNAKRGMPHYALSLAVASGPTMADVEFGYVYDFGQREEWWARRGEGAWLNSSKLDPSAAERRDDHGRVEMLGIESADPRWVQASIDALVERTYRLRALGSIASALCQVAAARLDGLVSLRNCRAVDAAAAQLIVREAGGFVSFPSCSPPLGCPLDAEPRSPVVAARSAQTLRSLEQVPVAG